MTHALGAVALFLAANAPAAKKSSSSPFFLIIIVIGAAFYFLIYRPQQRKQKAAQAQSRNYEVGDEVVTAGGIVGRVLDIGDDRVTLETSVGASFTVLRPYILRKIEVEEPPTDVVDEPDEGDEHGSPTPPVAPPEPEPPNRSAPDRQPPTAGPATPPPRPVDEDDGSGAGGADGPPII